MQDRNTKVSIYPILILIDGRIHRNIPESVVSIYPILILIYDMGTSYLQGKGFQYIILILIRIDEKWGTRICSFNISYIDINRYVSGKKCFNTLVSIYPILILILDSFTAAFFFPCFNISYIDINRLREIGITL